MTTPEVTLCPRESARLKIELLSNGLQISALVGRHVAANAKPALRVRSGSCGGLDVVLPDGTVVNCPVYETFASKSPMSLQYVDGEFFIRRDRDSVGPICLTPTPDFYHKTLENGIALSRIGQLCGDRLGIGLTNDCFYWRASDRRCKFCSIGLNLRSEQRTKSLAEIVAVVDAAYCDPIAPARHLLLGGGTPDGPDAGASLIAEAASAIKSRWDRPIYAMIVPPEDNADIDLLKESGVDELGMNVEIINQHAAEKFIPGKVHLVGLNRYLSALEHAVKVFGPINTRSILVVGLEPPESTLRGVELLASMGVMPILSPFRPMTGTELEGHPPPDPEMLWELCCEATEIAGHYGIPLGPTCIPCQENTLTLPGHPAYRYY